MVVIPPAVDLAPLCTRCGLCCCVLRANCTAREVDDISIFADINPSTFAEGDDPEKLVIKFPCKFLRGRPLKGVLCAIYDGPRPKVCTGYLCRTAIQYRLGELNLDQAFADLQKAFWQHDQTIFNWCGGSGEDRLLIRDQIYAVTRQMIEDGVPEDIAAFDVASQVIPHYEFESDISAALFSMHFATHDRRMGLVGTNPTPTIIDAGVSLYFEDEYVVNMTARDKDIAFLTISAVLTELRQYLRRVEPKWTKAAGSQKAVGETKTSEE